MSKQADEISTTLVGVTRVTKVVKGGRKFSFAACVVAGNGTGSVGYGHGKAKEVTEARVKATQAAKKAMIKVPLYQGRTIHHDVQGRSGAAKVILRKAKPGTGIIAGGPMRAIFESIGVSSGLCYRCTYSGKPIFLRYPLGSPIGAIGILLFETTSAKPLYPQQKSLNSIQAPINLNKNMFAACFFLGWHSYWGHVTKNEIPHSGVNSGKQKYASRWGPVNICSLDGIIPVEA